MTQQTKQYPLRILVVSVTEEGANDYAFVRAFRRAGHSVKVVSHENFLPRWNLASLKVLRRLILGKVVLDYNQAILQIAVAFRPDLFFVFKGPYVSPKTIEGIKSDGAIAIQFYPDTGFQNYGNFIERSIKLYDWFFSTKPDHVITLRERFGFHNCSFIPHAFDPEVHSPAHLSHKDLQQYQCDVSFIGNISAKKHSQLREFRQRMGDVNLKIWGPSGWLRAHENLLPYYQGYPVLGREYAKAIAASKVCLALLYEGTSDADVGDFITARTFEIPAVGGFMLHERTNEACTYFRDEKECVFFSSVDDLVEKCKYYLANAEEREKIANAGRNRSLMSGYSIDDRVAMVLAKFHEIKSSA